MQVASRRARRALPRQNSRSQDLFHLTRPFDKGCVPIGPTTHTFAAYSEKLRLKVDDERRVEVQTSSCHATVKPCWFHDAPQCPNDCAYVTSPGQEMA